MHNQHAGHKGRIPALFDAAAGSAAAKSLTLRSAHFLRKNLGILFLALVLVIIGVVLHECGHFLAALAVGYKPYLHFASTTVPEANPIVIAAGPAATALLILAGLIGLWRLRRNRRQTPATLLDWVATLPALYAARWLYNLTRTVPYDEQMVSVMAGLPGWGLPCLLGAIALVVIVLAIRLHPPGSRVFPFCSAAAGIYLGVVLWLKVLGPRVLP